MCTIDQLAMKRASAISLTYFTGCWYVEQEIGIDWIIHLDTDELLHPAGAPEYSVQRLLHSIAADVDMVVFPNYVSPLPTASYYSSVALSGLVSSKSTWGASSHWSFTNFIYV